MNIENSKTGIAMTPAYLVGLGHGATHWIAAAFYFSIPFLSKDLGLTYFEASLLGTLFYGASFAANLFSGPLVDLTGRRVLLQVTSLVIGAAALFGFGQANLYWTVCLAVVVIGATNNLWHPAAITYLSIRFPERRGFALSLHALGANAGDAVAPLVIGYIIVFYGWRDTASLAVLLPILVALILYFGLKRTGQKETPTNIQKQVSSQSYLEGMKTLLRRRLVLQLCLMSGFRNLAQAGLMVFLPIYLIDEMGLGADGTGWVLFAFQFCGMMAAPVAGHISDRIGRRPVVLGGLTVSSIFLIVLTFVGDTTVYVAGISVLGFALFAIRPVAHSWLMDVTPDDLGGSATSMMFGIQSALAAIGPAVSGWLALHYGLQTAFYFLGAGMLVANLLVLGLPKEDPQTETNSLSR